MEASALHKTLSRTRASALHRAPRGRGLGERGRFRLRLRKHCHYTGFFRGRGRPRYASIFRGRGLIGGRGRPPHTSIGIFEAYQLAIAKPRSTTGAFQFPTSRSPPFPVTLKGFHVTQKQPGTPSVRASCERVGKCSLRYTGPIHARRSPKRRAPENLLPRNLRVPDERP